MKTKINKIIVYVSRKIPFTKQYKVDKIKQMREIVGIENLKLLFNNDRYTSTRTLSNIKNSSLEEKLKNFITVLEENFKPEDLHNLYYNKEWLSISIRKFNVFNLFISDEIDGQYDTRKNKIYLYGKNDSSYHELFHTASNDSDSQNTSTGFEINIDNYSIGEALNEGYTQLLTKRYFPEDNEYESYYSEKIMSQNLELIVGKEKMQPLYLNANFLGLINELKQYYSLDEIEKFFVGLDIIKRYNEKRKVIYAEIEQLKEIKEEIILFLVKGYCIKNKNKEIDINNLIYFIFSMNIITGDEVYDYKPNIEKINIIIEKYLGNEYILDLDILNQGKVCYNK